MKGDYIFFWNADTIAPKNAFKVALEVLSQTGALAAICTSHLLMDPRDMKAYGKDFRDDFVVLKKAAFDLVGYFNKLFYVGEYELLRRLEEKDRAWVVNLPFTCIHLKPKRSLRGKLKDYFDGLKRYFFDYSKIYMLGFKTLPLTYKLRFPYYLLLPWIVFALLQLSTPLSLFIIAYILLGLAVNLIFSKRECFPVDVPSTSQLILREKVTESFIANLIIRYFMYNIPRGLSFAYGTAVLYSLNLLESRIDAHK